MLLTDGGLRLLFTSVCHFSISVQYECVELKSPDMFFVSYQCGVLFSIFDLEMFCPLNVF